MLVGQLAVETIYYYFVLKLIVMFLICSQSSSIDDHFSACRYNYYR